MAPSSAFDKILARLAKDPNHEVLGKRYLALAADLEDDGERHGCIVRLAEAYLPASPADALQTANLVYRENQNSLPALRVLSKAMHALSLSDKAAVIDKELKRLEAFERKFAEDEPQAPPAVDDGRTVVAAPPPAPPASAPTAAPPPPLAAEEDKTQLYTGPAEGAGDKTQLYTAPPEQAGDKTQLYAPPPEQAGDKTQLYAPPPEQAGDKTQLYSPVRESQVPEAPPASASRALGGASATPPPPGLVPPPSAEELSALQNCLLRAVHHPEESCPLAATIARTVGAKTPGLTPLERSALLCKRIIDGGWDKDLGWFQVALDCMIARHQALAALAYARRTLEKHTEDDWALVIYQRLPRIYAALDLALFSWSQEHGAAALMRGLESRKQANFASTL